MLRRGIITNDIGDRSAVPGIDTALTSRSIDKFSVQALSGLWLRSFHIQFATANEKSFQSAARFLRNAAKDSVTENGKPVSEDLKKDKTKILFIYAGNMRCSPVVNWVSFYLKGRLVRWVDLTNRQWNLIFRR